MSQILRDEKGNGKAKSGNMNMFFLNIGLFTNTHSYPILLYCFPCFTLMNESHCSGFTLYVHKCVNIIVWTNSTQPVLLQLVSLLLFITLYISDCTIQLVLSRRPEYLHGLIAHLKLALCAMHLYKQRNKIDYLQKSVT